MQEAHKNTESVAIAHVSESCQQEIAEVLLRGPQPVFIGIGNEVCMIVKIPFGRFGLNVDANDIQRATPQLHKCEHGELRAALEQLLHEQPIGGSGTVRSTRVRSITKELRRRGLDVKPETVRTKLRQMGYFKEKRNVPERYEDDLDDDYAMTGK